MKISPPSRQTLRKYGLTAEEWIAMWKATDGACHFCGKRPKSGKLYVDHDHIRRWRYKKPEERKRHVRGLVDAWCNRWRIARNDYASATQLTIYLENHRRRLWRDAA